MNPIPALPVDNEPIWIIVHSVSFISYVQGLVKNWHGPDRLRRCYFVVLDKEWRNKVRGIDPRRLFWDHWAMSLVSDDQLT